MPAATYGDAATTSASVIKTQYRVTVTSLWGVSQLPVSRYLNLFHLISQYRVKELPIP